MLHMWSVSLLNGFLLQVTLTPRSCMDSYWPFHARLSLVNRKNSFSPLTLLFSSFFLHMFLFISSLQVPSTIIPLNYPNFHKFYRNFPQSPKFPPICSIFIPLILFFLLYNLVNPPTYASNKTETNSSVPFQFP